MDYEDEQDNDDEQQYDEEVITLLHSFAAADLAPTTGYFPPETKTAAPATMLAPVQYKTPAFVQRIVDQATLSCNNAVVGARASCSLPRTWLVGLCGGSANKHLKAAVTFRMMVTNQNKAHESAVIDGKVGCRTSVNVFGNGKMLVTGAPDVMTGVMALYNFCAYLNKKLLAKGVIPEPIYIYQVQPYNLHCVLDLRHRLVPSRLRTHNPATFRPDVINHVAMKLTSPSGHPVTMLAYGPGAVILIASGNYEEMQTTALQLTKELAQYTA